MLLIEMDLLVQVGQMLFVNFWLDPMMMHPLVGQMLFVNFLLDPMMMHPLMVQRLGLVF
tara:strand:- start:105 stop:281 length:177 start_codon:yes stop_codon:yes gene_type:complete